MKAIDAIILQGAHQAEMLRHITEYRYETKRKRAVYGVYNQNNYLIWWSLSRKHAESHADKLRWDDTVITIKKVPPC